MSKTVTVKRSSDHKAHRNRKVVKVVRRRPSPLDETPLGVPLNVKVKGERTMLKHVTLDVHPTDPYMVVVRTGQRGRPKHLHVESIERVRVL